MRRDASGDEVPLGAFEEQVLLSVIHAHPDGFGMNVRREIEARTGREVAIGAVYATLDRLESKGLVGSSRSGTGGTRRVFQVTTAGVAALRRTRLMREQLWEGIQLERYLALRRA